MRRKRGEGFCYQGAKVGDRTANAALFGCGSNHENRIPLAFQKTSKLNEAIGMDSIIVSKQDFHAVSSTKLFLGLADLRVVRSNR